MSGDNCYKTSTPKEVKAGASNPPLQGKEGYGVRVHNIYGTKVLSQTYEGHPSFPSKTLDNGPHQKPKKKKGK